MSEIGMNQSMGIAFSVDSVVVCSGKDEIDGRGCPQAWFGAICFLAGPTTQRTTYLPNSLLTT